VLLDFMMPGLSGLGILRVMPRFGHVPPNILLTGFPDESVEVFARRLGAFRVLRKPADVDKVSACVREAVAGAKQERRPQDR
jgi:FixJ family two-component response regulator